MKIQKNIKKIKKKAINKRFIKSDKFGAIVGETYLVREKDAMEELQKMIDKSEVIIGHSIKNDMKVIKLNKKQKVIDTSDAVGLLTNLEKNQLV